MSWGYFAYEIDFFKLSDIDKNYWTINVNILKVIHFFIN